MRALGAMIAALIIGIACALFLVGFVLAVRLAVWALTGAIG